MKKTIIALLILGNLPAYGSDEVCGFGRGFTYCAKEIAFEESTDANGFQKYFLSGLTKDKDGKKVSVERNVNKDTICNAIVGSYHSEHKDSIVSIKGTGNRWYRFSKNTLKCIVQWKL